MKEAVMAEIQALETAATRLDTAFTHESAKQRVSELRRDTREARGWMKNEESPYPLTNAAIVFAKVRLAYLKTALSEHGPDVAFFG